MLTGKLIIMSSPSGGGKGSLIREVRGMMPELGYSVSHTTRPQRFGEEDGREYHFVDRTEFLRLIEQGAFLEWAEVHGNLYGTGRAELERNQGARGIIFDIDHQGARQIKSSEPDAVAVFILPPSMSPCWRSAGCVAYPIITLGPS